jgi:hypothetical protein
MTDLEYEPRRPRPPMRLALLMGIFGAAVGFVAGYLLPMVLMAIETKRTGYDAGNAGVLICCTVPLLAVAGLCVGYFVAGGLTGADCQGGGRFEGGGGSMAAGRRRRRVRPQTPAPSAAASRYTAAAARVAVASSDSQFSL